MRAMRWHRFLSPFFPGRAHLSLAASLLLVLPLAAGSAVIGCGEDTPVPDYPFPPQPPVEERADLAEFVGGGEEPIVEEEEWDDGLSDEDLGLDGEQSSTSSSGAAAASTGMAATPASGGMGNGAAGAAATPARPGTSMNATRMGATPNTGSSPR